MKAGTTIAKTYCDRTTYGKSSPDASASSLPRCLFVFELVPNDKSKGRNSCITLALMSLLEE